MFDQALLNSPVFREIFQVVVIFLLVAAVPLFVFRKKGTNWAAAWASVFSWLVTVPILFAILLLPSPWPLVTLALLAILGMKIFFQITGMYHRTNFVYLAYAGVVAMAIAIDQHLTSLFQTLPMILLGFCSMVPILRNSSKQMLQYISLTLVIFGFMWGFMHIGWLLQVRNGNFVVIYMILLTEVSDTIYVTASRFFKKVSLFYKITSNRTLEGFIIAISATVLLAWGLRHLLPDRDIKYWLSSGLVIALVGSFGDLSLSLLRRDLGIKDVTGFIIGRSDLLSRMDRFIFVAPIYYYMFQYLEGRL